MDHFSRYRPLPDVEIGGTFLFKSLVSKLKVSPLTFKEKYGPVALVAGASEGLGAAFASSLAARGLDLVLVARREEPLKAAASIIAQKFNVSVQTVVSDLSNENAVDTIVNALGEKRIHTLVYNAASSHIGPFLNTPLDQLTNIALVNTFTPLRIIHRFAGTMIADRRGAVVLMSSLAGFQGSGYLATYAASKAFSRILAESLWYEWKKKGVDILACCAGATGTPNYYKTNPKKGSFFAPKIQTPEKVAEECIGRIGKSPSFISGRSNRIASFVMQHLISKKMAINLMGDTTKKMYGIED
jgi:uncharacterized protein